MLLPTKHQPNDPALKQILELIQSNFAYMDPLIDPPSSMHRLTIKKISNHCVDGEVWSIGTPPKACIFLKTKGDALYLGKLAVAKSARGTGLGKRLIQIAEDRTLFHGKSFLELETRIELVENHRIFEKLGFEKVEEGSHAGYERVTYIVMRKRVSQKF
jgi:GNAT superfamily N-acetyltransferase